MVATFIVIVFIPSVVESRFDPLHSAAVNTEPLDDGLKAVTALSHLKDL